MKNHRFLNQHRNDDPQPSFMSIALIVEAMSQSEHIHILLSLIDPGTDAPDHGANSSIGPLIPGCSVDFRCLDFFVFRASCRTYTGISFPPLAFALTPVPHVIQILEPHHHGIRHLKAGS